MTYPTHLLGILLTVSTIGMSVVGTATASPLQGPDEAFLSKLSRATFRPSYRAATMKINTHDANISTVYTHRSYESNDTSVKQ